MRLQATLTLAALAAAAFLGAAVPAFAGSASQNMTVSATVIADCTIATAPIAFGSYDPLNSSDTTANGSVSVTCTNGAPITIELDNGQNSSHAGSQTRAMTDGSSHYLTYDVFQDAGHSTEWGSVAASHAVSTNGTGAADAHSAYGLALHGQTAPPIGVYSDTVLAKVNF